MPPPQSRKRKADRNSDTAVHPVDSTATNRGVSPGSTTSVATVAQITTSTSANAGPSSEVAASIDTISKPSSLSSPEILESQVEGQQNVLAPGPDNNIISTPLFGFPAFERDHDLFITRVGVLDAQGDCDWSWAQAFTDKHGVRLDRKRNHGGKDWCIQYEGEEEQHFALMLVPGILQRWELDHASAQIAPASWGEQKFDPKPEYRCTIDIDKSILDKLTSILATGPHGRQIAGATSKEIKPGCMGIPKLRWWLKCPPEELLIMGSAWVEGAMSGSADFPFPNLRDVQNCTPDSTLVPILPADFKIGDRVLVGLSVKSFEMRNGGFGYSWWFGSIWKTGSAPPIMASSIDAMTRSPKKVRKWSAVS